MGFSNGELIRYRFNVDRIVVASDGSGAVRAVLVDSTGPHGPLPSMDWSAERTGFTQR